uniref:Uncharacterized protein n=1 Tax=Anopheles marajoara TaxID=58244 RepID=A0A2M4BHZ0_9DIPT
MTNIQNMPAQQFSLRWNNYTHYIATAFDALRYEEDLVDVTLCCEGRKIRAHKMLLSACSPYLKDVFKENPCQHPVIIFKNVRYTDLMSVVEFMYKGEVSIGQDQLPSFLHTAEMLSIHGLSDNSSDTRQAQQAGTVGSASSIGQQLLQTQPINVLDKSLATGESLPSNFTIVHQPKLVQAQLQTTSIISKAPALTPSSSSISRPLVQQQTQQQATLTKVQVQTTQQHQQQGQTQQQLQQVQQLPQVIQQSQQQTQQMQVQTQQQSQQQQTVQTTQATTLQEVVDSVVQKKKKRFKLQQIATTSQLASTVTVPTTTTVTMTANPTGPSTSDGEIYEQEAYKLTDVKVIQITSQNTQDHRQMQPEEQQVTDEPEFIGVDEAMGSSTGNNNAFMQESYQLVAENIEEKDEDEAMAQDSIELKGSDIDMSRIFQRSSEEPSKPNLFPVSMYTIELGSQNKLYKCPECRRSFSSANAMKRHHQAKHSSIQTSFICPICEARFKTTWSLSTHKSKYHRGQSTSIIIRTNEQDSTLDTGTKDTGTKDTGTKDTEDDGADKSKGQDSSTLAQETRKRTASGGMVKRVKTQTIVDEDPKNRSS